MAIFISGFCIGLAGSVLFPDIYRDWKWWAWTIQAWFLLCHVIKLLNQGGLKWITLKRSYRISLLTNV